MSRRFTTDCRAHRTKLDGLNAADKSNVLLDDNGSRYLCERLNIIIAVVKDVLLTVYQMKRATEPVKLRSRFC